MKGAVSHRLKPVLLGLLILFYLGYVAFIIKIDRGPIDYETFMQIGSRLLHGQEVYGINSYYPMPFVYIFAFFSWLPRPVSMAAWLLLPPLFGLIITKWKPWVLLFGPMFSHFLGGQSALFGLLGYWGYRKYPDADDWRGGLFLALTSLKPQLGVIPIGFAAYQWILFWKSTRRIPRQAITWLLAEIVLYIPSLIISPGWISRWLASPRPLALRAMEGLIPRGLAYTVGRGWLFWVLWIILSGALLIWLIRKQGMVLDRWMLWYFIVSPLVHDYDLIQIIPQIEKPTTRRLALLLSIPTWIIIVLFYARDVAWFAVTIIAPGLLIHNLKKQDAT